MSGRTSFQEYSSQRMRLVYNPPTRYYFEFSLNQSDTLKLKKWLEDHLPDINYSGDPLYYSGLEQEDDGRTYKSKIDTIDNDTAYGLRIYSEYGDFPSVGFPE